MLQDAPVAPKMSRAHWMGRYLGAGDGSTDAMRRLTFRGAASLVLISTVLMCSGCATTPGEVADEAASEPVELDELLPEPLESLVAVTEPAEQPETAAVVTEPAELSVPEVALCYVGLEFESDTLLAETVRVDAGGEMIALVGAGDKVMVRYAEGSHEFSVAPAKASKKERRKNSFAVELRPFTYTKILIQDASFRKQKRVLVRVLQDGEEVESHLVDL